MNLPGWLFNLVGVLSPAGTYPRWAGWMSGYSPVWVARQSTSSGEWLLVNIQPLRCIGIGLSRYDRCFTIVLQRKGGAL